MIGGYFAQIGSDCTGCALVELHYGLRGFVGARQVTGVYVGEFLLGQTPGDPGGLTFTQSGQTGPQLPAGFLPVRLPVSYEDHGQRRRYVPILRLIGYFGQLLIPCGPIASCAGSRVLQFKRLSYQENKILFFAFLLLTLDTPLVAGQSRRTKSDPCWVKSGAVRCDSVSQRTIPTR